MDNTRETKLDALKKERQLLLDITYECMHYHACDDPSHKRLDSICSEIEELENELMVNQQ